MRHPHQRSSTHGLKLTSLVRLLMLVITLAGSVFLLGYSAVARPAPSDPGRDAPPRGEQAPLRQMPAPDVIIAAPEDPTVHKLYFKSATTPNPDAQATSIRVTSFSANTIITNPSCPDDWTMVANAEGVTFNPPGGKVPAGELPDPLTIKVAPDNTEPQFTLVEWLGAR